VARRPAHALTFLGAADTVTGSRFLAESGGARVLIDCGMFQGLKELRLRNRAPFPVEPSSIDAVALTHAHLDHVGYLPALVRAGFRGPVLATAGTAALAGIILPDSGRLQEDEAAYAARHGYSKHHPPLPLYTEADARRSLRQLRRVELGIEIDLPGDMTATFHHAGHILGAAQVEVALAGGRRLWSTGDLGHPNHPLLLPPAPLGEVDVLLVESTYGDRLHRPHEEGVERLAEVLERTDARGGMTIIPAFAVDRTELLLMELRRLKADGRVGDLPVYVDSPMALGALDVYLGALATDPTVRPEARALDDPFDPGRLQRMRTPEESRSLNHRQRGVIISASGMATGGRVLHHLARRLPDARNTVVLTGYQAPGTRGRSLQEGAGQVKIHGEQIPVRAEVVSIPTFSVHADRDQILAWLAAATRPPTTTYIVHGEPAAAQSLREAIDDQLGWHAVVPEQGQRVPVR
jgi:metallo-beta-lactamase family protein